MLKYWILAIALSFAQAQHRPLIQFRQQQAQPQIQLDAHHQPQPVQPQQQQQPQPHQQQHHQPQGDLRQIVFGPIGRQQLGPQQIPHELLPVLEPQFQLPVYNFINEKQQFPRVLIYQGGVSPGHTLFVQSPGNPGNFLVPQQPQQPNPGPNVILGNDPQKPVFVAGYPKPAHIPPIERDAEEIPTNPSKIPPLRPDISRNKPEKLETFNEPEKPEDRNRKQPEEVDPTLINRNPLFNKPSTNNLRPGQRFFILNGQPLFSNYPYFPENDINLKYAQAAPILPPQHVLTNIPQQTQQTQQSYQPRFQPSPQQNFHPNFQQDIPQLRQPQKVPQATQLNKVPQPGPQFDDPFIRQAEYNPGPQFKLPQNLLLDSLDYQQDPVVRTSLGLNVSPDFGKHVQFNHGDFYQFDDDDSIVIDAKSQNEPSQLPPDNEVERSAEPTISQAQPGAIALAGPGGVAEAAPRGSAFVGKGGVAVSNPTATAVAGPSKEEDKKKPSKTKKP